MIWLMPSCRIFLPALQSRFHDLSRMDLNAKRIEIKDNETVKIQVPIKSSYNAYHILGKTDNGAVSPM